MRPCGGRPGPRWHTPYAVVAPAGREARQIRTGRRILASGRPFASPPPFFSFLFCILFGRRRASEYRSQQERGAPEARAQGPADAAEGDRRPPPHRFPLARSSTGHCILRFAIAGRGGLAVLPPIAFFCSRSNLPNANPRPPPCGRTDADAGTAPRADGGKPRWLIIRGRTSPARLSRLKEGALDGNLRGTHPCIFPALRIIIVINY